MQQVLITVALLLITGSVWLALVWEFPWFVYAPMLIGGTILMKILRDEPVK